MKSRDLSIRILSVLGACIGYGCLAAFLWLVCMQIYRWFREGEWTHIGMIDGLRSMLNYCCAQNPAQGAIGRFLHWLDAPADWLGLHRVFEVMPASLALFAVSIAGNCLFIYFRDRARRA